MSEAFDQGVAKFKPGKLNNTQRQYIVAASGFYEGQPIPFSSTNIPYLGQQSLNGLVRRGLMEERDGGFFYLTPNGWLVARAIHSLMDRSWEVREIDEYLAASRLSNLIGEGGNG